MKQQDKTLLNMQLSQSPQAVLTKLQTFTAISETYLHQLTLFSAAVMPANKLISRHLHFTVHTTDDASPQKLGGTVNSIHTILSAHSSIHHYKLEVTPDLWRLSLRKNCRVFQDLTALEILNILLKENGLNINYQTRLRLPVKTIEYITQFNETDLHFTNRLLAAEGMFYFFDEQTNQKQLIISDDNAGFTKHNADIHYNESNRFNNLYAWQAKISAAATAVKTLDHYPDSPKVISEQYPNNPSNSMSTTDIDLRYPGQFSDTASTKKRTKQLTQQTLTTSHSNNATTKLAHLTPGKFFELRSNHYPSVNGNYFIHKQTQTVRDYTGLPYANKLSQKHQSPQHYQSEITTHSLNNPFRSKLIKKPTIPSSLIATVAGNKGSEIDVDALGRVLVRFPWDKDSLGYEKSSKRIRVKQIWAGKDHGHLWIPRIGQEVLVVFENGDIDRPLVWAAIHNSNHNAVYDHQQNNKRVGIRSKTLSNGAQSGSSELTFDNNENNLQLFIHAEKDFNEMAHGDYKETIQQGHSNMITQTGDYHIKAKRIDMHALEGIHLKVDGQNYIKITPDGIHLQSGRVELNNA